MTFLEAVIVKIENGLLANLKHLQRLKPSASNTETHWSLKKMTLEKIDLTFVSNDDLLNELVKRHDAIVITGVRFTKTNGDYVVMRRRNGNRFVCIGLLDTFRHLIEQEENQAQYQIPPSQQGNQ